MCINGNSVVGALPQEWRVSARCSPHPGGTVTHSSSPICCTPHSMAWQGMVQYGRCVCNMGGESLPGSACQGHNPDMSWHEGWVPASGAKAADLATNTSHVMTAQLSSANCETGSSPKAGFEIFQIFLSILGVKEVSTATLALHKGRNRGHTLSHTRIVLCEKKHF